MENSIGMDARRDLGCSEVVGRPLPPPRPPPTRHRGTVVSPNHSQSIPSLLRPVIFPSCPSIQHPGGDFPPLLSPWGQGSPGLTHPTVSQARAFHPPCPTVIF